MSAIDKKQYNEKKLKLKNLASEASGKSYVYMLKKLKNIIFGPVSLGGDTRPPLQTIGGDKFAAPDRTQAKGLLEYFNEEAYKVLKMLFIKKLTYKPTPKRRLYGEDDFVKGEETIDIELDELELTGFGYKNKTMAGFLSEYGAAVETGKEETPDHIVLKREPAKRIAAIIFTIELYKGYKDKDIKQLKEEYSKINMQTRVDTYKIGAINSVFYEVYDMHPADAIGKYLDKKNIDKSEYARSGSEAKKGIDLTNIDLTNYNLNIGPKELVYDVLIRKDTNMVVAEIWKGVRGAKAAVPGAASKPIAPKAPATTPMRLDPAKPKIRHVSVIKLQKNLERIARKWNISSRAYEKFREAGADGKYGQATKDFVNEILEAIEKQVAEQRLYYLELQKGAAARPAQQPPIAKENRLKKINKLIKEKFSISEQPAASEYYLTKGQKERLQQTSKAINVITRLKLKFEETGFISTEDINKVNKLLSKLKYVDNKLDSDSAIAALAPSEAAAKPAAAATAPETKIIPPAEQEKIKADAKQAKVVAKKAQRTAKIAGLGACRMPGYYGIEGLVVPLNRIPNVTVEFPDGTKTLNIRAYFQLAVGLMQGSRFYNAPVGFMGGVARLAELGGPVQLGSMCLLVILKSLKSFFGSRVEPARISEIVEEQVTREHLMAQAAAMSKAADMFLQQIEAKFAKVGQAWRSSPQQLAQKKKNAEVKAAVATPDSKKIAPSGQSAESKLVDKYVDLFKKNVPLFNKWKAIVEKTPKAPAAELRIGPKLTQKQKNRFSWFAAKKIMDQEPMKESKAKNPLQERLQKISERVENKLKNG